MQWILNFKRLGESCGCWENGCNPFLSGLLQKNHLVCCGKGNAFLFYNDTKYFMDFMKKVTDCYKTYT